MVTWKQQKKMYERVIAAQTKSLGSEHIDTLSTMGNLAVLLFDTVPAPSHTLHHR